MKRTFTRLISSFAVCLMMIYAGIAHADTFTAIASGSWSSTTTWSGGNVPPNTITSDEVVIGSGFVVDLDQDITINRTGIFTSASLSVDGELSSTTVGRTLTITSGELNGSGTIKLNKVKFLAASTIGFTGTIEADEMEHSILSLVTTADYMVKEQLYLKGALSIGGSLELSDSATIIVEGGSLLSTGNGTLDLGASYEVTYRSTSTVAGMELSGSGLGDVTVDVGENNDVSLTSDASVNGTLRLLSGELTLNGNHLTIMGDLSDEGSGMIASTDESDINIAGSGSLEGSLRFASANNTVRNFSINRAGSDVTLGSDLQVTGILNLNKAGMHTGSYALDIMSGGSIMGATKDQYIITDTDGRVGFMLASGGNFVMYPVGTEDNYAPAAVKLVTGTSGMVRINTINVVYAQGNTGSIISETDKVVKNTWNITSGIGATLNLDLKLMWSGSMEVNSFDRSNAYISHCTSGTWDVYASTAATAEADDMFSLTRSGITSLSPFSVQQGTSSGLADINAVSSANVYPNPATDYLVINNVEHVNIEIINQLGQVVKRTELNGSVPLNLTDLERGNYFIRISSDDASTVKKFVKL